MSNPPSSFGKFSSSAKAVLLAAQRYAETTGVPVGSEHLLLAITVTPDTPAYRLLRQIPITPDQLRLALSLLPNQNRSTPNKLTSKLRSGNPERLVPARALGMRPEAKSVLERAAFQASVLGTTLIETEFILWSLVSDQNSTAYQLIRQLGVEPKSIRKSLEHHFLEESAYTSGPHDIEILGVIGTDNQAIGPNALLGAPIDHIAHQHQPDHDHTTDEITDQPELEPSETPVLDEFTIDLTQIAAEGKMDPIIGREKELERLTHILGRKTKNNPIMLGEPGVGKTAIVEGLAQRIIAKNVPDYLQGARILSLELGNLIAGTMYRGQFEERLRRVVSELLASEETILFIDEVHTVVGAGSSEGSLDAANILKPALAKGNIRIIGATTTNEYQKYIEKDAALERRLQPVFVSEPTSAETRLILEGIAPNYAAFHGVKILPELLDEVVQLADRYLHGRQFPDKAIDLLDEAAAARKSIQRGPAAKRPSRYEIERELKQLRSQKELELRRGNFERAAYLRDSEAGLRLKQQRLLAEKSAVSARLLTLSSEDLRSVISRWTGLPVARLTAGDRRSLLELEQRLQERVIGQKPALASIAAAIRRARSGMKRGNRPIGSFLLVGPTGVGKTETARALAEELFGDAKALLKLDMSEYMERHQVARLLGAPPGYIGHEQSSVVLEQIRRRPHQVILFDEIEKAHPDVFHILLQILEDGVITDSKGRSIQFRDTLILLTSNIGGDLWKQGGFGFQSDTKSPWWQGPLDEQLRQYFRPELLGRLDEVLTYLPLDSEHLSLILARGIDQLASDIAPSGITVTISQPTKQALLARITPSEGARAIRRLVESELATPLSDAILRWPSCQAFEFQLLGDIIQVRRKVIPSQIHYEKQPALRAA